MNREYNLLQIFNKTSCLSERQIADFVLRKLVPEEERAIEQHLIDCPFCNEAIAGYEVLIEQEKTTSAKIIYPLASDILKSNKKHNRSIKNNIPSEQTTNNTKEAIHAITPIQTEANIIDEIIVKKGEKQTAKQTTVLPTDKIASLPITIKKNKWLVPAAGIAATLGLLTILVVFSPQKRQEKEQLQLAQEKKKAIKKEETMNALIAENAIDLEDKSLEEVSPTTYNEEKEDMQLAVINNDAVEVSGNFDGESKESNKIVPSALTKEQPQLNKTEIEVTPNLSSQSVVKSEAESTDKSFARSEKSVEPDIIYANQVSGASGVPSISKENADGYEKGMELYRNKDYSRALVYLKTIENNANHPHYWDAIFYSAMANKHLKRNHRAITLFEKIAESGAPQKSVAEQQLKDLKESED